MLPDVSSAKVCFTLLGVNVKRESLAKAFVGGAAFAFERRVPTNISYKIPKVESSYVLKELKAMSANKATGIDGITSRF